LGSPRLRAPDSCVGVAFSPDGKVLASGHPGGRATFWHTATGRRWREVPDANEPKVFRGQAESLAFSPDGKWLAVASEMDRLYLWDFARDSAWDIAITPGNNIYSVAYSPDGKWLAVGYRTGRLRLYDAVRGKFAHDLVGHAGTVRALAFSPDSKTLASGSGGGGAKRSEEASVRLWDVATGKQLHRIDAHGGQNVRSVAFCSGGKALATSGWDRKARLWDVATGRLLRVLPGEALALAASPDGKLLALGNRELVRVWDVAADKEAARVAPAPGRDVWALAFSPDGKTLAGATRQKLVGLWQVATGRPVFPEVGHREAVLDLRFSPDGRALASRGADNTVRLWAVATAKERHVLPGQEGPFARGGDRSRPSLAFSPDGKALMTLCPRAYGAQLWDVRSGKPRWQLKVGRAEGTESVDLSPDGRTLATAQRMGAGVWSAETGLPLRFLDPYAGIKGAADRSAQRHVLFSPDGRTLAVADNWKTVHFWDYASGELLWELKGPDRTFLALSFSPDGNVLATCSLTPSSGSGAPARLWDVPSGTLIRAVEAHKHGTGHVALSPDGLTLATCGTRQDPICRLFNAFTGQRLAELDGGQGAALCSAFSPDGRTLAVGGEDSTILLWGVGALDHQDAPRRLGPGQLDALWAELAKPDAATAYPALWRLRRAKDQAPAFLKGRLPPVPHPDPRRVRRLLAELDSNDFKARDTASEELGRLAEAVEAELRGALAGRPSAEAARRLRALLAGLRPPLRDAARLRAVRAVQVLEGVGSPAARAVLKHWASGAPQARLTRDAQAALRRLEARAKAP
jgi:WD40 repeat protein